MAPGFAGLYQLNIYLDTFLGMANGYVPLTIRIGDSVSPPTAYLYMQLGKF